MHLSNTPTKKLTGENAFDLSMCELESFIALQQCQRTHLFHFLYNKTYSILIFSENISHVRFTVILKYFSFLGQEQTDSQQSIRVVFDTLASTYE